MTSTAPIDQSPPITHPHALDLQVSDTTLARSGCASHTPHTYAPCTHRIHVTRARHPPRGRSMVKNGNRIRRCAPAIARRWRARDDDGGWLTRPARVARATLDDVDVPRCARCVAHTFFLAHVRVFFASSRTVAARIQRAHREVVKVAHEAIR